MLDRTGGSQVSHQCLIRETRRQRQITNSAEVGTSLWQRKRLTFALKRDSTTNKDSEEEKSYSRVYSYTI
jgi:hypothetical protein